MNGTMTVLVPTAQYPQHHTCTSGGDRYVPGFGEECRCLKLMEGLRVTFGGVKLSLGSAKPILAAPMQTRCRVFFGNGKSC